MASCSFCSGADKKLYKAIYYKRKVFICKHCAFEYHVPLEKKAA